MNLFNNCSTGELPKELQWMNEPKEWSFTQNGLILDVAPSSDFFLDPAGQHIRNSAPFLYTEVDGDFSLTTKVSVDMQEQFDSGCLMVMAAETNWAKLCFENINNVPSIVSVVTKGTSDDCNSHEIGKVSPFLKILRSGNCFGFHFSLDGSEWTMIRYFGMDMPKKIKIGVVGQSPVGKGCKVSFDRFDLEIRPISSAREVK
jgi:uncharacterized protein